MQKNILFLISMISFILITSLVSAELPDNTPPIGEVLSPNPGENYYPGTAFPFYGPAVDFGYNGCAEGEPDCTVSGVNYCDIYAVDYDFSGLNESQLQFCQEDLTGFFEQAGVNPYREYLSRTPYLNGVCDGWVLIDSNTNLSGTAYLAVEWTDMAFNERFGLGVTPWMEPVNMEIEGPGISCGDTIYEDTMLTEDILNCPETGLIIGANDITLDCDNHYITGSNIDTGILLENRSEVTIKHCAIRDFRYGIKLYSSPENRIYDNDVRNGEFGIRLYSSSNNNAVSYNTVSMNSDYGIYVSSSNNVIKNNSVSDGNNGIFLSTASNNDISYNDLFSNDLGVYLSSSSNNNLVFMNNISNNIGGIQFRYSTNDIINNTISGNNYAIHFTYANNSNIYGNTISNNYDGISVQSSTNNNIWNNNFIGNVFSAYEFADSNNNNWNIDEIGNYWDDFADNLGYPCVYIIDGEGDGIDYHPAGGQTGCVENHFYAGYGLGLSDNYYDNITGGGACNQPEGCEGTDLTDSAWCPGPNYCVLDGVCYSGNGSVTMDIDGTDQHHAICVGFGWWDFDAGGGNNASNTPIPGMQVCELGGYVWAKAGESGVGEYEWSYNGGGCCGDDTGEYYYNNQCWSSKQGKKSKALAFPRFS